ncbi:hypothetical protein EYZ11_004520 [Aspergillus tanneri]|uniref:Bacteriocin-protection protein n=1 Tax=Aspergillus tanneri TaxID=1220188 RepID=A0A4S3JRA1_9EURO|nr:uncharacterized protein ATNIH1004_011499 [Aspergillus tanneri]KAA8642554.1 hypothetical protein ATNIH1004_011499 [Aspergillus tanneri]THC96021.1 hypothetical protein EYZ11_004520 [Aspergillus tanneri]
MLMKPPPSDLPIYSFSSAKDFEAFLEREHSTAVGFYLKLAKKSSGIPSISAPEAVEVALCFGWIDGRGNRYDKDWWLVRYTPRRPKSIWSQKNTKTAEQLIEQGRMRPNGMAAVEAAKSDGRWARAYAGAATMTVPDDFAKALAADTAATAFFQGLNKSNRYAVLWRVQTASPQARVKRIQTLVQMLGEGKQPGVGTKPVDKRKRNDGTGTKNSDGLEDERSITDSEEKQPRRPGLRRRK